jgi:5-methylcytosine-specific restriction endonuclease McrA
MKKHTKLYLDYFGYGIEDFIPCESCGSKAVDIHHIEARGMGGDKKADNINNLMALCRQCHLVMGDTKTHMEYLKIKHKDKLDGKS